MNYDFTEDEVKIIIKMYQDGVDIEEIMNFYCKDESSIRKVLKGEKIDRRYNTWTDELYDRAVILYSQGLTQLEVSKRLCCAETGVRKALRRHGMAGRKPEEANRRHKRNSNYFHIIDTPNKAYILGMLYADGNNFRKGNKHAITLQLQEEDKSVLERIKGELEYEGPLRFIENSKKKKEHKDVYGLIISDKTMSDDLLSLGVIPCKSLLLTFPTWLRPDLVRHFIRGYFDGDGNIYHDSKRDKWRASLAGTFEFCTGVQKICEAYYIKTNIYHPKQCLDHNTYVLQCSASNSTYQFLSFLYQDCDIKMDRKYNSYLQFRKEYKNHKDNIKSF